MFNYFEIETGLQPFSRSAHKFFVFQLAYVSADKVDVEDDEHQEAVLVLAWVIADVVLDRKHGKAYTMEDEIVHETIYHFLDIFNALVLVTGHFADEGLF